MGCFRALKKVTSFSISVVIKLNLFFNYVMLVLIERKNGVYSYSVECHHFAAFPTVFTPTLSNLPMGVSRFNEIKPRYSS